MIHSVKNSLFHNIAIIFYSVFKHLYIIEITDYVTPRCSGELSYFARSKNEAIGKLFVEFPGYMMKNITKITEY